MRGQDELSVRGAFTYDRFQEPHPVRVEMLLRVLQEDNQVRSPHDIGHHGEYLVGAGADGAEGKQPPRHRFSELNLRGGVAWCPLYGFDVPHFKEYSAAAKDEAGFQGYAEKYLGASEADYQAAVGGLEAIQTLPLPTY